jgi:hypothetical protein
LRQEEFGYVVMRGNRVVPLSTDDYALLQTCNGKRTLRQIQNECGARGLRTIAQLYKKGIVEFAEDSATRMREAISIGD